MVEVAHIPKVPEAKPPEELHLGEKVLQYVDTIILPPLRKKEENSKKIFREVFGEGSIIGGLKVHTVEKGFLECFGDVIVEDLPAALMPVWRVVKRNALLSQIREVVAALAYPGDEDPPIALGRFYQTIFAAEKYSKDSQVMNLMQGVSNILFAWSTAERCAAETPHALFWYKRRRGQEVSIEARHYRWPAMCPIGSLVFGARVPEDAPAAAPATEPALA